MCRLVGMALDRSVCWSVVRIVGYLFSRLANVSGAAGVSRPRGKRSSGRLSFCSGRRMFLACVNEIHACGATLVRFRRHAPNTDQVYPRLV